jgi:predicted membrane protein
MAKKRNFHESFVEHDKVEGPSNRNFGYTVGGIFLAIAILKTILVHFSWISITFLILGGILVTGAALKPDALTPLNKAWMKLAEIMFVVVNPVIMFLMYVVCFIPAGLIMKIVGYDPMKKKFDKDAKTYWIERKDEETMPDPMKYQF